MQDQTSSECFTEEFLKSLTRGKYTSWAATLTPDQLQALLWALGEFYYRMLTKPRSVVADLLAPARASGLHPRGIAGLGFVLEFATGRTFSLEEVMTAMRKAAESSGSVPSRSWWNFWRRRRGSEME